MPGGESAAPKNVPKAGDGCNFEVHCRYGRSGRGQRIMILVALIQVISSYASAIHNALRPIQNHGSALQNRGNPIHLHTA